MHIPSISPSHLTFLLLAALIPRLASAQSPIVVTVQAPRPTHEPSFVADADFVAAVLNSTNLYRYEHGVPALAWNDSLAAYAQQWTESCNFEHSHGPSGENLAEGYDNVTASIEAWGDERTQYDWSHPDFSEATGHFTQLIWRGSRTVGCGRKFCTSGVGGWYVVCEYWPAGNVIGAFDASNVPRQVNDGKGYSFQNCTLTSNCTALPGDSETGGGGAATGAATALPSSTAVSGDSGSGQPDGSQVIVGPMMAGIIVLATAMTLWEPWQNWEGALG